MVTPLYETGKTTWAPSGIVVYKGKLYIAALRGEAVQRLSFSGENPETIVSHYGRIRDVEIVEGELYLITNNTDGRGNPDQEDDQLLKLPSN
ncbi:PQQ-dependent sugar dehydrogenase [Halobacillus salinarum]|uniref:PQQ-dependent sugar dehydrogenase n=1 Tax=Halobacillus salinarum TaxID=2932257 RepID=UPI002961FA0D|nr:PQQ-dependent sugar dehydrogenase [Halobacillus salinarum]